MEINIRKRWDNCSRFKKMSYIHLKQLQQTMLVLSFQSIKKVKTSKVKPNHNFQEVCLLEIKLVGKFSLHV